MEGVMKRSMQGSTEESQMASTTHPAPAAPRTKLQAPAASSTATRAPAATTIEHRAPAAPLTEETRAPAVASTAPRAPAAGQILEPQPNHMRNQGSFRFHKRNLGSGPCWGRHAESCKISNRTDDNIDFWKRHSSRELQNESGTWLELCRRAE